MKRCNIQSTSYCARIYLLVDKELNCLINN